MKLLLLPTLALLGAAPAPEIHWQHLFDGTAVLRYDAPELDRTDDDAKLRIAATRGELKVSGGYFALQSEGHPIEFRNIALLPLD